MRRAAAVTMISILVAASVGLSMAIVARAAASLSATWTVAEPVKGVPVGDGETIYVQTAAHDLLAVARGTGHVRWRASLHAPPGLVSTGRVLVAAGDRVVAGLDGIEAFRASDGVRLWRAGDATGVLGVYLGAISGGLVFAGSQRGALVAIALDSGAIAWSASLGDERTTVFAPVWSDGQVVAGFSDFGAGGTGGVAAFDRAGARRWRTELGAAGAHGVAGGIIVSGDDVLAAVRSGEIDALDRRTGVVRWSLPAAQSGAPAEDFRPLAAAGRLLFAGSLTGQIVAYDLDTRRERWRSWPVLASVAFALAARDDVVYVPYVSGVLVAIDARDGRELWRVGDHGEGFRWLPMIDGSSIYLSGGRAGLVSFQSKGNAR